jgi:hypothetical protein
MTWALTIDMMNPPYAIVITAVVTIFNYSFRLLRFLIFTLEYLRASYFPDVKRKNGDPI